MEDKVDGWFKPRGYLHFDVPVGFSKAQSVVKSPSRVASHSFWPFIRYDISFKKIEKDSLGSLRPKDKTRPISYASHLDTHIYSYYARLLEKRYEAEVARTGIGEHVLAFRKLGKSNIEFARDAFQDVRNKAPISAVALDVSDFFGAINHEVLKKYWSYLLGFDYLPSDHFSVFKSLTKYSYVDRHQLYEKAGVSSSNPKRDRARICSPKTFRTLIRNQGLITTNRDGKGIPQGSPISALLSNIYMLDFDSRMSEVLGEIGGSYYRYCDDMLFLVPCEWEDYVEQFVNHQFQEIGLDLSINASKTEKRHFNLDSDGTVKSGKPLQYLGFLFDGERTYIRSAAFARFSNKMRRGVRLAKKSQNKWNKYRLQQGVPEKDLYKRKLYERYSHLGRRNFITYGLRAARVMKSRSIRRQLKPLWKELQDEVDK